MTLHLKAILCTDEYTLFLKQVVNLVCMAITVLFHVQSTAKKAGVIYRTDCVLPANLDGMGIFVT